MFIIWSAIITFTIPALIYVRRLPKFRLLTMDSFHNRIVWSLRCWLRGMVGLPDAEKWDFTNCEDVDLYGEEARFFIQAWTSLAPFFRSHGYILYQSYLPRFFDLYPAPNGPYPKRPPEYPYGRRLYIKDERAVFSFVSPRVWPARDHEGRDVVVRLASGRNEISPELQIFQRLNTAKARADPRNHTLQVIEYLTFDGLTFVVMPRWDCAIDPEFCNVDEAFRFIDAFLQVFDFLHEHRIAHLDFLEQNTAMNLVIRENAMHLPGLRDPTETKYAVIDFGASLIYPLDTSLEDVREDRYYCFHGRGEREPVGPQNPFKVDLYFLGVCLESRFRFLEEIVPELGPFLDSIVSKDLEKLTTARKASQEFRALRECLTEEQQRATFTGYIWQRGRMLQYKSPPDQIDLDQLNMYLHSRSGFI